jgi:hypothetical protein
LTGLEGIFAGMDQRKQEMPAALLIGKECNNRKSSGGFGILDLSKFNMALRLRWQWYKWKDTHKSWTKMNIRHSETEES